MLFEKKNISAFFLGFILSLGSIESCTSSETLTSRQASDSAHFFDNDKFKDCFVNAEGKASYYAHRFHNRKTANGEKYDMYGFTAAHKKLPFGTIVKVTNKKNDKTVLVRINDRGPFKKTRVLDLAYRAAKSINGLGTADIEMDYFDISRAKTELDSNDFIGYSFDKDFVVLDKTEINFIDSADDFEEIINIYSQYNQIEGFDCYLFVGAKQPQQNVVYYVGSKQIEDTYEQKQSLTNLLFYDNLLP